MDNQDKVVDQLWYTWSDEGLDTIRAGFRVRAASEGLHDISSERTQRLDRYERYSLPRGVDPSTVPGYPLLPQGVDPSTVPEDNIIYTYPEAPVCLSLINTEQERILVQKAY